MATTINATDTYTVSGADLINCITQAGYLQSAITTIETAHPAYNLYGIHANANLLALIAAFSFGFDSDTFHGNGTVTSTTPTSGGTNKGGSGP